MSQAETVPPPLLAAVDASRRYRVARSALARLLDRRTTSALHRASFEVRAGDVLGIVGESGSGKSTLARLLVGLDRPSSGQVSFEGRDLAGFAAADWQRFRNRVQFVFQGAHTALNPRKTVARSLSEAFAGPVAPGALEALLAQVSLGPELLDRLPHQLSGGQKQRIGIARALARQPEVLIADEPTSALDVSVQNEIIALLQQLHRDRHLTLVIISHDLGLVGAFCDRVLVMYAGRIVEMGPAAKILAEPAHPYTQRLVAAIPRGLAGRNRPAEPPLPEAARHGGCPFEPRCSNRIPICAQSEPPEVLLGDRLVRCHVAPMSVQNLAETNL
ncbi:ABC transporter ATP-binding protein [Bosea sp. 2KB_26]|uniref:ABC transporter ATP-binding protein n=1 Tax=Bosea sp. 2KB_26 TaxID=3237475 RepID=UPI003F93F226